MITKPLNILILSLLFPLTAIAHDLAPAELVGVRFEGPANPAVTSSASFGIGLTLDNGATYESSARVADQVRILGTVHPEPAHLNQKADLFMVTRVNGVFMMKNLDGVYVIWNGRVPDLVPFVEDVTLTADMAVDMFIGTLGVKGDHRIFLGYSPQDGKLYYTPNAHRLDITEQSATEQAYEQFVSFISPNLIQSRCIQCHVNGGLAQQGGAYHIFQLPLGFSTQTNFGIFKGLVNLRGVDYILTKVTGGNAHGGGVQLVNGSPDYEALEHFLNLVATDLPVVMPQLPGNNGGMNPEPNPYEYPY
ncbi:MAG: hypothetical protein V4628_17525 [Pseudomonadota bacterium]